MMPRRFDSDKYFLIIRNRLLAHNSREEAIPLKKIGLFLLLTALSAALLTGCTGSADTLPSPTPGVTGMPGTGMGAGTAGPAASAVPQASDAPQAGGIQTVEDAMKASEAMEDAIDKLSEVEDAEVAVIGDTALVGITFAGQYQGKVDDRLKKMVLARVQTVDKTVKRVAVTDDKTLVQAISALEGTLEKAPSLDDVADEMKKLADRITVYTE